MTNMTIQEAATQLSDLITRARAGEEIVIALEGEPAVRLTPIAAKRKGKRPIGLDAGKIIIHDSFFDPLPEDFMKAFE